jgi:hypothetical protein
MLDITHRQLALYLATGDELWVDLKMLIKTVDSWSRTDNWPGWNYTSVTILLQKLSREGKKRLATRLTGCEFYSTLKEQGTSSWDSGPSPESLPLPSSVLVHTVQGELNLGGINEDNPL